MDKKKTQKSLYDKITHKTPVKGIYFDFILRNRLGQMLCFHDYAPTMYQTFFQSYRCKKCGKEITIYNK